jgi:hypothetical protein
MLLQLLRSLKNPYAIIFILVGCLAAETYYIRYQRTQWNAVKASYEHPQTIEVVRVVRTEGPVRIVTRVVESSVGDKVTTIEENKGPTLEEMLRGGESNPVPVSEVMPPVKTNRWLVGLSLLDFSPRDTRQYTLWGGYSFWNRLDLLYGLNYKDGVHQNVMGVVRF